jgi:iron complex outermembrane receptor protein
MPDRDGFAGKAASAFDVFQGSSMSRIRFRSALLLAFALSASVAAMQTARAQEAQDNGDVESIVVIGSGQTRSVSTLLPQNLTVQPPGASIQKSLNILPGVSAQSIDALGVNEQSMTLQVRGFSTTHLGYTLDGMPLGDGAYNNYNGLTISRALTSENLGRADLATGIAGLGIASTSNLGGAILYTSSAPKQDWGVVATQTFGSSDGKRSFVRVDSGEVDGFSAYLSGAYSEQDLFVNQAAYKSSYGKQVNGKAQYQFDRGKITAFMDLSRTNQADDPYLSKDMLSRLGYDYAGYAPDWTDYLSRAACTVPSLVARCVASTAPEKTSDVTFTNGSILRNDDLFYVAGDYAITDALQAHLQVYRHTDKGAGNNFIVGLSNQGTAATADDLPVQIRDTRYTINRDGVVGSLAYDLAFNHLQAGFWLEENTSSASRYIRTNVTGPFDLGQFLRGQPSTAQWVQQTQWGTQQFYLQDTISLLDDTLGIDFGFKGTHAKSNAKAQPGISVTPPPATTQFATGTLTARDFFLPEAGAHWKFAPGHEVYASYSENLAMFQGGFKLGPQSVTQAVWDVQGSTLVPETSRSFDFGYRYINDEVQLSLAGYHVNFDNRLLQYNPCPTALQQNPGCGNSFHNAGSVTSNGAELGVQWQPLPWLSWYNSASYDETTYDQDLNFCTTTCILYATAGKQQVDTPKQLFSSVLTVKQDGFWASLQGKFTGRRYYTYTNDQGFGAYTTFDLGMGYDFGAFGGLSGAKLAFNVTNLTDLRYASNFDNSVFAPNDPTGSILVFHSSAPRQFFATFGVAL